MRSTGPLFAASVRKRRTKADNIGAPSPPAARVFTAARNNGASMVSAMARARANISSCCAASVSATAMLASTWRNASLERSAASLAARA